MKTSIVLASLALAVPGCKKDTGGGGGGGGGWLVGSSGMMTNIKPDRTVGPGYDLGSTEQLNGIACRFLGEAWVVGAHGTLLYTNDGGESWSTQSVPTTKDLRAIATQDFGPVFVAGDGSFLESRDTGTTWTELGDGTTHFRAVAAAQEASTVLALSDDGGLWAYDGDKLVRRTILSGAHAIAVAPNGYDAMIAGQGLWRSTDAGMTWTSLAVDPSLVFDDVRLGPDGSAVAVGADGAIANIGDDNTVAIQHVGTSNLHALHIADWDAASPIGYAAGDGGNVLITHDSGATWEAGPHVGGTVLSIDVIGLGHR